MSIPAVAARWIIFVLPHYCTKKTDADWYIAQLEQRGMNFMTGEWRKWKNYVYSMVHILQYMYNIID